MDKRIAEYTFGDYLKETETYEEVKENTAKEVLVWQIQEEMKKQKITKAALAKMMNTSRMAVDNLLDPEFNSSIDSLFKIASALGKYIHITLA